MAPNTSHLRKSVHGKCPWRKRETKTFLTTPIKAGGLANLSTKESRIAAFDLAQRAIGREHGTYFGHRQISSKYIYLKRIYNRYIACSGSKSDDLQDESYGDADGSRTPAVEEVFSPEALPNLFGQQLLTTFSWKKSDSSISKPTSFRKLNLLFRDPDDVKPIRGTRRSARLTTLEGGGNMKQERVVDDVSKYEIIDLTQDEGNEVQQPVRERPCAPVREGVPSPDTVTVVLENRARSSKYSKAGRSISGQHLEEKGSDTFSKTERAVVILMKQYAKILDKEEMNEALSLLENDKKALIFVHLRKGNVRSNWLRSLILSARGI